MTTPFLESMMKSFREKYPDFPMRSLGEFESFHKPVTVDEIEWFFTSHLAAFEKQILEEVVKEVREAVDAMVSNSYELDGVEVLFLVKKEDILSLPILKIKE